MTRFEVRWLAACGLLLGLGAGLLWAGGALTQPDHFDVFGEDDVDVAPWHWEWPY